MKAKTELLLYHLLWTCEMLATPTFRNLTGSFEGWAYRNGLHRQIARLERQGLLESLCTRPDDRLYRLTPTGLCLALGHGDPEAEWCQPWDGRWRLLLFDLPVNENPARNLLRARLREHGFGCLQGSVWITPKPVHRQMPFAADGHVDVSSLIVVEARPVAGEQDAQIVRSAWDFAAIDDSYGRYLELLRECPSSPPQTVGEARALLDWINRERQAWRTAARLDPFLPEALLPPNYLGQRAWHARLATWRTAAPFLRDFHPSRLTP